VAFTWMDDEDGRFRESRASAILNDAAPPVSDPVGAAMRNYGVTPVVRSEREACVPNRRPDGN